MPRSDEHNFVTATFIDIAQDLFPIGTLRIRGADRGTFDFACSFNGKPRSAANWPDSYASRGGK